MGAGAKEFNTNASAFIGCVAEIDNAALLLLFSGWIGQDQFGAEFERLVQIEQAAVRIDDNGLTLGAEFAALGVFPGNMHGNPRKDAGTAAFLGDLRFWHVFNIVQCTARGVNYASAARA